jgi:hypothetical protein
MDVPPRRYTLAPGFSARFSSLFTAVDSPLFGVVSTGPCFLPASAGAVSE